MRFRFPFSPKATPFEGVQEHAEKVKECAWSFQQAIECHLTNECKRFEEFRAEVVRLEQEADAIKRRVRGHLPKGTRLPIEKFQLFRYLKEQDNVLDAVEESLNWLSFRADPGIPPELHKDFILLIDAIIDPIEEMSRMVSEAMKYFETYSEKHRVVVKDMVRKLRQQEHEADQLEDAIKEKALNMPLEPMTAFHMVRLAESIGKIADHAENAGDMMRAMMAR